ncbi:SDR family oxidoreductase [Amycolatopsis sp. CA-230715]|uniref:SDR family oxidoreductase n=1 Tax=Amycolatopsis sp. CA-230715 TaxID=2745196 RepID=UPI001C32648B|nr:SDR family oxidoreductase [Amycolatopsis sp. CA-230715]QWF85378.1 Cyclic-di-GMP-binding biofilm dispersal mediator protein [Amycolatopsis sp. CA-230715]
MHTLTGTTVVIIGGASGIGLAVAREVVAEGATVVLGGRDTTRLDRAVTELGTSADAAVVDTTDKASIAAFFDRLDRVDHLFTPGASYGRGPLTEISDELAESPFRSKFWGQYYAVKHALPRFSSTGSVVLMGGAYGARPPVDGAAYAACNAAIEGLGRALALELRPIRVNVVAPGLVDSDLWTKVPASVKDENFASYREKALISRAGSVAEIAHTVRYLMTNTYTTGSVLYPDGGYALR